MLKAIIINYGMSEQYIEFEVKKIHWHQNMAPLKTLELPYFTLCRNWQACGVG